MLTHHPELGKYILVLILQNKNIVLSKDMTQTGL